MSFPSIPPEGEGVQDISQEMGSSKTEQTKVSPSILKTTAKSSSTVRSILKKSNQESSASSSKKVSFSSKEDVRYVEKYLEPLEEDEQEEDHEGEEDDIDEETMKNTLLNEDEGSRVQLSQEFFIPPESQQRRSPTLAENVYNKLPRLDKHEHKVNIGSSSSSEENRTVIENSGISSTEEATAPEQSTASGMRIGGIFRRITTSINNIGDRIRALLVRIGSALSQCWTSVRSNQRSNSEVVLVSVRYNPDISSVSLETLSD